jgi:uncharacterized protein YyaL (SSP411 family)
MKNFLLLLSLFLFFSCTKAQKESQKKVDMKEYEHTNELINETSPYLLQHAHNPVNWMPWNEKTLAKAKVEKKPLLISIGYSACHWCHVMEHESFEDSAVAALMNENFICIKVDREERPDVDQVYMNAVQLMTGRGGWPLNCFATPDGRPFYGGTYFPKDSWVDLLNKLITAYKNEPQKIENYANQLTSGVQTSDLIVKVDSEEEFTNELFEGGLANWSSAFDPKFGGNNKAPKFPIPSNYDFLLRLYYHTKDPEIKDHLDLSLEKMAFGGIYDQIGGGFARYSTDMQWKVPHFEKMLYDNSQLVSLYSKAYRLDKNPLYKQIVFETIDFVSEEFTAKNGAFYSALDADSEGEEGKYYVWRKEELKQLLGENFTMFKAHFNVNNFGFWEHENYVLIRDEESAVLAQNANLTLAQYEAKIEGMKKILKKEREKRVKPGLDDKSLTSWNALMVIGLVDAYHAFGEKRHLNMALENAKFLTEKQQKKDGSLWHSYKDGKSTISAYLEDYSFSIEAFIKVYEVTANEDWLNKAKQLADYSIENFYDSTSGMFYFTNKNDAALIARKFEVSDNVIPSSNSSMAKGLFSLAIYFDDANYHGKTTQMLRNIAPKINDYLPGYSNWAVLLLNYTEPFYEVAITGEKAISFAAELQQDYVPNKLILMDLDGESALPLVQLKWTKGASTIFVCENKVCQLPVSEVSLAKAQILSE